MENPLAKHIGKTVQIYPGDTYYKYGIITDVNEYGWTFKITRSNSINDWETDCEYFVSHSTGLRFKFID